MAIVLRRCAAGPFTGRPSLGRAPAGERSATKPCSAEVPSIKPLEPDRYVVCLLVVNLTVGGSRSACVVDARINVDVFSTDVDELDVERITDGID